jgi:tetratricopeptide (TPR) repeat protein
MTMRTTRIGASSSLWARLLLLPTSSNGEPISAPTSICITSATITTQQQKPSLLTRRSSLNGPSCRHDHPFGSPLISTIGATITSRRILSQQQLQSRHNHQHPHPIVISSIRFFSAESKSSSSFDPFASSHSSSLLKQPDHDLTTEEVALKRALEYYQQDKEEQQQQHSSSPSHSSSLSVLEDLHQAYHDLGYWHEALQVEQLRCDLYLLLGTSEHADSIHTQGKLYLRQDDFYHSKKCYQQALDFFSSPTTNNPVQRGHVLISMSGWYYFKNHLDTCLKLLLESEVLLDTNPALLVKNLDNQGLIYRLQEDYETALDKYRQALQVVLDDKTRQALQLHVADMLVALERPLDALELYMEILDSIRPPPGVVTTNSKDDDNTTTTTAVAMRGVLWHNIAKLHVELGDYDVALEEFHQALEWKKLASGGEHNNPEVMRTLQALGALLAMLDQKSQALECFQQALMIARIHADNNDPGTDPDVILALRSISVLTEQQSQDNNNNNNKLE